MNTTSFGNEAETAAVKNAISYSGWVQSSSLRGTYQLAAIEVMCSNFEVTCFVEC